MGLTQEVQAVQLVQFQQDQYFEEKGACSSISHASLLWSLAPLLISYTASQICLGF